ncbi:hypothetical protein VTO42DRAFT_7956 [Malbranchea cinnamomea]
MSTPIAELDEPKYHQQQQQSNDQQAGRGQVQEGNGQDVISGPLGPNPAEGDQKQRPTHLDVNVHAPIDEVALSPSRAREEAHRLQDDLALLEVERQVSLSQKTDGGSSKHSLAAQRSRRVGPEPVDEFDVATNPLHEQAAKYNPPEDPSTSFAKLFIKVHNSSFLVRYFTYITPLVLVFLIPLLVGALAYPDANVGGVELTWFAIWLEIFWLTLWAGRIAAKFIPGPVGIVASLFTNNAKKWRDMAKQLELPAALFFWWLGVEISFLPTMTNHHVDGSRAAKDWEVVVNKIIIAFFVGFTLNFVEKIIIQLIAMSFHMRTYADRIEINKFQIGSLTKLYAYSKQKISIEDREFEESGGTTRSSGAKTPMQYADKAQRVARETLNRIGDVAGAVAGDFTGRHVTKSNDPHQVVLTLLSTTQGSQVLARRLYRTFVREGFETVFPGDLKSAFDSSEEAEAAFTMFDKDMNGDISMEELEAVCVEIGRERKSITASLKDLDSVVSKLDDVFMFIVVVITVLVLLSLISTSAAGVLTSAGSTLLALSWLFSATAQELLASVVFVFVKHPFDVGDRVTIYGQTGDNLQGDDYYVKEIALLYTEFKKMQGHIVQAPNSYLNTLFILNQRRSGPLAEAVPIIIKYGTTLQQIEELRHRLLEFVRSEKREYDGNILTELREVTENYSITLNVVFFYKSNWQNELLRLQRRNKFICNLMLCLQEVGIEGPRQNLAGFTDSHPYYIAHQGAPPRYTPNPTDPSNPHDSEAHDVVGELASPTSGSHQLPGILRNRAGTVSSLRGTRRESTASRKHVDFSLGVRGVGGDDPVADVFEDRKANNPVIEVIRKSNKEAAERRLQEQREREAEERHRASLERTASNRGRTSVDTSRTGASTSVAAQASITSSIQRNRFLSRLSRSTREESSPVSVGPSVHPVRNNEEDLMEQGRSGAGLTSISSGDHLLRSGSVAGRDRADLATWPTEPPHTQPTRLGEAREEPMTEMREYTQRP